MGIVHEFEAAVMDESDHGTTEHCHRAVESMLVGSCTDLDSISDVKNQG